MTAAAAAGQALVAGRCQPREVADTAYTPATDDLRDDADLVWLDSRVIRDASTVEDVAAVLDGPTLGGSGGDRARPPPDPRSTRRQPVITPPHDRPNPYPYVLPAEST